MDTFPSNPWGPYSPAPPPGGDPWSGVNLLAGGGYGPSPSILRVIPSSAATIYGRDHYNPPPVQFSNPWLYRPQGYNGGGAGGVPDTVGPDYMSGPSFITGNQMYGTTDPRLQPDRNGASDMRAYKNALNLKEMLAEKVRVATANAQAADAAQKLNIFNRMTPAQTAAVYGSAPTTPAQTEIDRAIADAENGGNAGFKLGYDTQRQNTIDREREAQLQRLNRDSDLNYQIKLGKEEQDNRLFDLQSQRVGTQQQREDRLQGAQESRAHSGLIKSAIDAVAGGTVHPDDVQTLFPELSPTELQLVRNYGRQYQGDFSAANAQAQSQADELNQELRRAKQTADAAPRVTPNPYKDTPWYLPNWLVGAGTGIKDPTAPSYLPNFLVGGGNEQVLGPRPQSAEEAAIIARGKKEGRGTLVYDPALRNFVPVQSSTSPRLANGQPPSPFYMPTVSGASPDHAVPQTSTGSYGPTQPSPLLNAFDVLDRSGAAPVDRDVQTLNSRFPNAREGQSVNNGQFVFHSGQWMRLR